MLSLLGPDGFVLWQQLTTLMVARACFIMEVYVQLPFNIFWSTMFTQDAIDELSDDLLMPTGQCLSFQDLGINPQKVSSSTVFRRSPAACLAIC